MPDCIIKDTGDGSDIEMGGGVSKSKGIPALEKDKNV
jgi:hypothetical protein